MNIWIVGADGAIGRACERVLKRVHACYAMGAKHDVTSEESIYEYIRSFKVKIDAIVYAVGWNYLEWSDSIISYGMNHTYDVNVTGLVRCLQYAPYATRVVAIGSDAAQRPMRTSVAYNASKAALEAAVKCIARERANLGFQINVVAPGVIDAGMTEYVIERSKELRPKLNVVTYMGSQIPAGRFGKVDEVAEIVRWLIEDAPEYVNGSVITMNGAR